MDSGEAAIVPRVHSLEHIESLSTTALTHNYAIGTHTQRVDDQIADGNPVVVAGLGVLCLEAPHMTLGELQLGGGLDGDDAIVLGDIARQHIEQRGLAGASAPRDDDVEARDHAGLEKLGHLIGDGAKVDQVLDGKFESKIEFEKYKNFSRMKVSSNV